MYINVCVAWKGSFCYAIACCIMTNNSHRTFNLIIILPVSLRSFQFTVSSELKASHIHHLLLSMTSLITSIWPLKCFLFSVWPSAYGVSYTMTARHCWRIHINIHTAPRPCINNASLSACALQAPIYEKEYKWCPCTDKKERVRGKLAAACRLVSRQCPRIISRSPYSPSA